MASLVLRVIYRVRSQNLDQFEDLLITQVLPLADSLGLRPSGIWKTVVGRVGEYTEHWEFTSPEEFHQKWRRLMLHPRFREIVAITGAMVEEEVFALQEPLDIGQAHSER